MPSGKEIEWLKPISKWMDQVQTPQAPQVQQAQVQQAQVQQAQVQQAQVQQAQVQQAQVQQAQVQVQAQEEQGGGTLDFLSITIDSLNTNPYFIGMLMLLLNLGGRFLASELTPKQEEFLQKRWLRPLLFFVVIFVATRNIAVAFWMTLALFMILWILANEQSPFCIIPSWKPFEKPEEKKAIYDSNMKLMEQLNAIHQ
jgi:hypothetical protein